MSVLDRELPHWYEGAVYEPSPSGRASEYLQARASQYETSVFHADQPSGVRVGRHRNENLERMTFAGETFDLVVTQDVLEHVFDPAAALQEIGRILRPGGHHLFTVPVDRSLQRSFRRAEMDARGQVVHSARPEYHGDPFSSDGALVVMEWGSDMISLFDQWSGLTTRAFATRAPRRSHDPDIDVFLSIKASQR